MLHESIRISSNIHKTHYILDRFVVDFDSTYILLSSKGAWYACDDSVLAFSTI